MTRLLVVDDEPINLAIITECLSDDGYTIDEATDGEEAWALMQQHEYDLVILDRMMPRLDGLELLKRIKATPRWAVLPVIMQTAAATQQQVSEGLQAGAYYYLTKPYRPEALQALVKSVVDDQAERRKVRETHVSLQVTLARMDSGEFVFRSLDDARNMASALSGLCAEAANVSLGLLELLVNAVEHGNLGISYAEKSRLREDMTWEAEIERRLQTAPWSARTARVLTVRTGSEIEFTISDEGDGFEWTPFLDFSPERAFDPNGRGIAMARRMGFTSLEYQGKGNIVIARAASARS
jgi:CheY-like chemotaxis protein